MEPSTKSEEKKKDLNIGEIIKVKRPFPKFKEDELQREISLFSQGDS